MDLAIGVAVGSSLQIALLVLPLMVMFSWWGVGDGVGTEGSLTLAFDGFQVSVFSGLGLATVFTLNAVLSQPIGGFDYLTSHLDADNRPQPFQKSGRGKSTAARKGSATFDEPPR